MEKIYLSIKGDNQWGQAIFSVALCGIAILRPRRHSARGLDKPSPHITKKSPPYLSFFTELKKQPSPSSFSFSRIDNGDQIE
jgi:hypothetical protein